MLTPMDQTQASSIMHAAIASPYAYPPDAGGGSGGTGSAAGSGDVGAGGTGTGGGSAFRLSDDALVDFGDGKPIKWSEGRNAKYVDRERWDAGVRYLEGEAAKLEQAWKDYRAGTGPKPQAQPQAQAARPDILEGLEDLAVIDGKTATRLIKALRDEGLGPLANLVGQMALRQQKLEQQVAGYGTATGQLAETHQTAQFEQQITHALSHLGAVKGLPDGVTVDAQDPGLRELAKDVFLSHEQTSWRKGEFEKMLGQRLEGLIALVRSLDKKAVDSAHEKRRSFFNPARGSARPSGQAKYEHLNGSQLADRLFAQLDGTGSRT